MVPTIGRRMYFFISILAMADTHFCSLDEDQPFDAGVLFVRPDGTVNVGVSDHVGNYEFFENVPVVTDLEPHDHPYWVEWMPYQKEQAAKAEAEHEYPDPDSD